MHPHICYSYVTLLKLLIIVVHFNRHRIEGNCIPIHAGILLLQVCEGILAFYLNICQCSYIYNLNIDSL